MSVSRVIASILAVSLVVSAPGPQAWGQVAATVRPVSVGAGLAGSAGAITSGSFAVPVLSLSGPSLSAPSMSAANLSPVPSALNAAAIPAAAAPVVAQPIVAQPVALTAATPAAYAALEKLNTPLSAAKTTEINAAFAPALAAANASAPSADGKAEKALGRWAAFFDGFILRKPIQDAAVNGDGQNDESSKGPNLNDPKHRLIPVMVTLSDAGSKEAMEAVIEKLGADHGFIFDTTFAPVPGPGVVIVRGAVPASKLVALKNSPGVMDIAGVAPGSMSAMKPVPYQAPARENLLRSGLRSLMFKKPLLGMLAMLPLQFAVMVAFMGPVMGGFALGGAAAVLKPWMIGTAFGMASSFSFLSPLFSWIPLKVRVGATYAAAGMLAFSFAVLAPGLPAFWLAANLLLGAIAAFGSLKTLAAANNAHPVDKAVNSTEAAAFINILGYQATLPILILGGMTTLAFGILAASSVLVLLLLIKTGAKTVAPALSDDVPSAPATPDATNHGFRSNAPAPRPAHQPFVPATKVIADMEKLFAANPAEALKVAAAYIVNEKERRSEVKIAAQRILDSLPIEQTLPHYLDLLKLTARAGVQTSKDVNVDPWWYFQRTALNRLAREGAALKLGTPELVDELKTAYKDRNASVRLAAAAALQSLGIDPGPEASYDAVRVQPTQFVKPAQNLVPNDQGPQKPKSNKLVKWLSIALLAGVLGWMAFGNHTPSTTAPATPPAITQTITAKDSAKTSTVAVPATDAKTVAPSAADSAKAAAADSAAYEKLTPIEKIAKDTKHIADASDRQAKALEEMAKPKSGGGFSITSLIMPILMIFGVIWLMKRMGGGGGSAGGISTKPAMEVEKPTTTFDDVAGMDETLIEVQELIDFMRNPARFKRLGARIPKGILLEGDPGTGKTLLARALAGETNANFIAISGSDFVELYVGMGARRVRELFAAGRAKSPTIIFIDEIDAVGKKRGEGGPGNGGNDEREQTINQILKEMDGFDNQTGIIVVAATNLVKSLDPALTRPGRFDRKIHVGLPEAIGREAILALHSKKVRFAPEVDLRLIARRTAGLSGAFLQNVINEAALLAARRGGDAINAADMDEAVDRATIGGKRSLRLSDALKLRIARHEIGHVAANLLNEKPEVRVPVNKVTIIPHGSGALGFAESGSEEGDKYLYTRAELEARLDTALGGLVAEQMFYGEWSTGPGSDLESATRVARAMVQQLGMSEEMGLAQTAPNQYGQSTFGGETDAKALVEINKLLKASKERVEKRFAANREKFEAVVALLVEKETLASDDILGILYPKPK